MRIVVDTSVLYAAAIRDGRVRKVFFDPSGEWLAPRATADELRGHLPEIARELHGTRSSAEDLVEALLDRITEIPLALGDPEFQKALVLVGKRDASDAPFVAAALKSGALGIWSLDKDFDGLAGIPRFSTGAVARLLEDEAMRDEDE